MSGYGGEFQGTSQSANDGRYIRKDANTTLSENVNVTLGTTTGTKFGTGVTQKLGFWNATPIVQPTASTQGALTNNTGGTADAVMVAIGNTAATDVSGNINDNFTELHTLLGAIRTALVNTGIIKGS